MKQFILLICLIGLFGFAPGPEKDECSKVFVKVKKSKRNSELFKDTAFLQTKLCNLYHDNKRDLLLSFVRNDSTLELQVMSRHKPDEGFKRKIVLGQDIRIGLIFSDKSNFIIQFQGSEQAMKNYTNWTVNQIPLSDELLLKLMSTDIASIEILNPFSTANQTKVLSKDLSKRQKAGIKRFAHCFRDKTQ